MGVRACDQADSVKCNRCNHTWKPEDIRAPGKCVECGADMQYTRLRCAECRINKLSMLMSTAAGYELNRVADIDTQLKQGFRITTDDITDMDWMILNTIWRESGLWNKEMEKNRAMEQLTRQAQERNQQRGK